MDDVFVNKRDGRVVPFDKTKIVNAIEKAFISVDGEANQQCKEIARKIADDIEHRVKSGSSVEDIQDLVEKGLMKSNRKDVAKAYIIYRHERNVERERKSSLIKNISEKILANNIVNQNANVDEKSFGGRKGEAANELMKQYALNYCMSEKSRNHHLNNEIYIHDLDSYAVGMHNCLTVPFDDLLSKGFNTRQTDVRPANSVNTAFQLVAVIFQLQSLQQFGGVSASHLDWTMVPYVRKSFKKHWLDGMKYCEHINGMEKSIEDDTSIESELYKIYSKAYDYAYEMTDRELKQAVEGLYHNLNTLQSRSGNQLN